jgi:hypothetical protein
LDSTSGGSFVALEVWASPIWVSWVLLLRLAPAQRWVV